MMSQEIAQIHITLTELIERLILIQQAYLILLKGYMLQLAPDSLDQQRQLYKRAQSTNSPSPPPPPQNKLYKQFYRQQLDELVQQRGQQKRVQKMQEAAQRNAYNDRISHAMEAERMKDLSYKNYYHMLLDNQSAISRNYVSPFDDKLQQKERLVRQNIQQNRLRSQALHEQQQRRQEQARKNYRQSLAEQINQKYNKQAVDSSVRVREKQQFKKLTYTPQEIAKFERERKVIEMQRYRQDLDKTSNRRERSMTNHPNDFNVRVEERHNPMVNPLPFNIQNPYILREMQRKASIDDSSARYY